MRMRIYYAFPLFFFLRIFIFIYLVLCLYLMFGKPWDSTNIWNTFRTAGSVWFSYSIFSPPQRNLFHPFFALHPPRSAIYETCVLIYPKEKKNEHHTCLCVLPDGPCDYQSGKGWNESSTGCLNNWLRESICRVYKIQTNKQKKKWRGISTAGGRGPFRHRMKREYNILDLLAARLLLCRNVAEKESACLELLTTSSAAHQATLRWWTARPAASSSSSS